MKLIRTMLPIINALPKNLKNKVYFLLILTVISTIFEVLILSLLYPFINSFLDSSKGSTDSNFLMKFLGFSYDDVPLFLGIIIIIGAVIKIIYVVSESRLSHKIGHNLGEKLFINTLNLDYSEHKKNNSSFFIALIVNKVNIVVYQAFLPIFRLLNGLTLSFSVLIYLVFFQPILTLSIIFGIVFLYFSYIMFIKSTIDKSANIVNDNQNLIIKIIQESLGLIKEIILSRSYKVFTKEFSKVSIDFKMAQSLLQIVSNLPKLIIEPSVMLLFIISLYFFKDSIDLASFVVVFLGLIRVLPSFQVVYYNFQTFYNGLPSIIELHNLLIKTPINYDNTNDSLIDNFSKIEFKSVNYKIDEKEIISNLNLKLIRGQKIGIFGKSGSGKSTFIDLLMGLIDPVNGKIIIDDKLLDFKLKNSWFSKIGHVKQDVFLIDDSIKKNIAFGIEDEFIDEEKVLKSLKLAGLNDMLSDLENGLDSSVGENGAFVSGGQRQRIGLARLFYFNKNILVLDEATSALDYKTEASILDNIYSLGKDYTIIMISHRTETLKRCDLLLEFPIKN